MAEDSHSGESPPQGGVFGNLPDSRPGTRSPRRGSEAGKPAPARKPAKASPASAGKPAQPAKPPPSAPAPPRREPATPGRPADGAGGIEDLAWAGVAAAAEAATRGVRLASRALDALRGSSERD